MHIKKNIPKNMEKVLANNIIVIFGHFHITAVWKQCRSVCKEVRVRGVISQRSCLGTLMLLELIVHHKHPEFK